MPYSKTHKHQTRQRILLSAEALFCQKGFDHVSIGEVMQHADMTHGAFYAHFRSKQALFSESMLDSFRYRWFARLAKGPFTIKHLTGIVADTLTLRMLDSHDTPTPASILLNEINTTRSEIRQLYEEAYTRMKALVSKRLTALCRLQKLPFARDHHVIEDKARAILSTLIGAVAITRNLSNEQERLLVLRSAQKQVVQMVGMQESQFILV